MSLGDRLVNEGYKQTRPSTTDGALDLTAGRFFCCGNPSPLTANFGLLVTQSSREHAVKARASGSDLVRAFLTRLARIYTASSIFLGP
jgi:hypothetical protein